MIFYREQKAHEEVRQPADAAGIRHRRIPAIFSLFPHSACPAEVPNGSVLGRRGVPSVSSSEPCERVRAKSAFTLVELMIVMVVIGIMVGITIPISKYVTLRARQASQKIYIEKIKNALEDYRAAYGEYPITPSTNISGGLPDNYTDVMRHYPDHYATECARTTNSPYVDVVLSTNTVEIIATDQYSYRIDYCLTYPLMLKQQLAGARPFMDFKNVTVAYLVYNPKEQLNVDVFDIKRRRKAKGGAVDEVTVQRIYGNPVNRPKAIDPVSQKQWKYISDGITYSLMTNTF